MGRIKVLDQETINQIAAGEIIERPASIVKELVENSIDAGATRIELEIKNGGRSLIRITDDGCGMEREDLELAVERHATSKIVSSGDLTCLKSLGFRGEALPSIAAVAQLEIATRARGAETGFVLEMKEGTVKKIRETGLPEGTTVRVSNLFGKVPVRLKYLKSIPTEAGYIADIVGKTAVAYPEISFRLIHHEYEILFTPGSGDHLDTLTAVYGRDIVREIVPIEAEEGPVTVRGFLGKPAVAKTNRNYELVYLNRRFIKNRAVGAAIEKAFHSLLPITRYPFAVIFLTISPEEVDVNVHPAKLEARFADESQVFRAVHAAVRRTLVGASLIFPWRGGEEEVTPTADAGGQYRLNPPAAAAVIAAEPGPRQLHLATGPEERSRQGGFRSLGVALKATYLPAVDEEGFLLIDQHAAHERVLYDRYLARADQELSPQRLLIPPTINLSFQQAKFLQEYLHIFEGLGFSLEAFGPKTFLLRTLPASLSRMDGSRLVLDLLDEVMDQPAIKEPGKLRESILAAMSCHAAVKAGDILSHQEMQSLLDDLGATTLPYTCPHGRPTVIRLSWDEIARRFKRR